MRITFTPEPSLSDRIREMAAQSGRSLDDVVNELLMRAFAGGETARPRERVRVVGHPMGLRPGIDPDRITKSADDLDDMEWAERHREIP